MKKTLYILSFILVSFFLQQPSLSAKTHPEFTVDQTNKIEKIVRNYIIKHPEILLEASKSLQEKEQLKEKARINKVVVEIPKLKKQIFSDSAPGRAVLGNPKGEIVLAEFTQHQCPHCRLSKPAVQKFVKENPNVKLITIYWPFFGNDAVHSSKAVLAANKQGKFNELNDAILKPESFMSKAKTDEIIKSTPGINTKKLYKDMESKEINSGIKTNFELAQKLHITGTPTYIMAGKGMKKFSLIPQTNNLENDLKQALKEVH